MTKLSTKDDLNYGLLAFIDLLVFSDQVKRIETENDLKILDAKISLVQDEFEHNMRDEIVRQSHGILGKKVLAFSDCIIISVPMLSDLARVHGTFDVWMGELSSFALAQGACVLSDIFVRGGIDLGFWFHRQDRLISPALVNAYELERDACVPMIAVTSDLIKYLRDCPERGFYAQTSDPLSKVLIEYKGLPNGQSAWFINYLRICLEAVEPVFSKKDQEQIRSMDADMRDSLRTEAWLNACRAWATQHGRAITKAYSNAGLEKVRAKYRWLADYHNAEVASFFGEKNPPIIRI